MAIIEGDRIAVRIVESIKGERILPPATLDLLLLIATDITGSVESFLAHEGILEFPEIKKPTNNS